MAIDPVFVSVLSEELDREISKSRIEKIQQPAKDLLLFSLRRGKENKRLVISVCPGRARINITASVYENPQEPPMFCMLLRKHLLGAEIENVVQPVEDRVIQISLLSADEFGRQAKYIIFVELMNRTPNFILAGEDHIILDCMHRLDYDRDMYRRLFPGMHYRFPQTNQSFSGFSPLIKREIDFRKENSLMFPERDSFSPTLLVNDGEPFEFSYLPIYHYGETIKNISFDSYSELLDSYYSEKENAEILKRKSREIRNVVVNVLKRTEKKLSGQREELEKTEKREMIRRDADLITANIYRIHRGDECLVCENYYDEGCPQIRIKLDPQKTPQENSNALYKEYRKMKTARMHLIPMIQEGEEKIEYLRSVLDEIERATGEQEINSIKEELVSSGIIRSAKHSSKQRKQKPLPVLCIPLGEGFEILVGRNNTQNDELTFKTAYKSDYWFHVKKFHGSHVILRCYGMEPSSEMVYKAAELAAEHSQAKGTGNAAVDYTKVKNVKKIPGALPGRVTYTDYSTISVRA